MSDNPNFVEVPVEQKVLQNNWNNHEFGLKPRNLFETLAANFIKAFSFISGWDENAEIWRALNTDGSGNLKTTNGTQSLFPPLISNVLLDTTPVTVLEQNPLRRSFMIINDSQDAGGPACQILVAYPNPQASYVLYLPVGAILFDDSWQGNVNLSTQTFNNSQLATIIEYY